MAQGLTRRRRHEAFPYLMAAPAFICIGAVCLYPVFSGIWTSFTNASLSNLGQEKFVGLDNYTRIAQDKEFFKTLGFTVVYTVCSVALSYLVGMVCALLMNRKIRFRSPIRAMLLLPWVVPAIVGTTAWMWILNDQTGIVNQVLRSLGIIDKPILFLSSIGMTRATVILFCVWKGFPFMALVILSALQGISTDLHEAASIDGASAIQKFFRITLPLIRRESLLAILLMTIWTFNNFDYIFLMTRGGPVMSTETVSIYSYYTAFSRNNLSYASTIAVTMMILMIVLSMVYFRINDRKGADIGA